MPTLIASAIAAAEALKQDEDLPAPSRIEVVVPPLKGSNDEFEKFPEADNDEVIEPAYYYGNTGIPVFKPTMDQFRSFKKFVDQINHYGMQSGIIKVIPPKEWTDSLPPLDEKVRDIKIKNPIEQHIVGMSGEYRQTNLEKQRTYNLPEWRQVCEGSDHQPPARRGERRRGQTQPAVRRTTRARRGTTKEADVKAEEDIANEATLEKTNPPTPESPIKVEEGSPEPDKGGRQPRRRAQGEETSGPETDVQGRQPRKKGRIYKTAKQRAEDREIADEIAFEGFDYRMHDADQYTPERCAELEKAYWRTLTYNNPLYGADMPGSLFDDSTTSWNVAKLENLLDCLGKKLPGVNAAYLYLGMWKSTFSWHLEDMDLYSINYIHFGAPKQWYSISRSDKPKFERVMKSIWPNEAKKCSQFLRHKTFLVSPTMLAQHGIKVNKLVHHQGEFVITFPFGYHSGYNLGYNCAESVNFATDAWLQFGRDAKKCECVGDSVFVDVDEIERKLRGEPTDDEYEYQYYDAEDGERLGDFPTPPESVEGRMGKQRRPGKRKSEMDGDGIKVRRIRVKVPKVPSREPCTLCPNDIPSEQLLPTEKSGEQAHRLCAIYTPETYFKWDYAANREIVANIDEIPKARLELKCMFCRQKKGSCFQCSAKKCTRAYHATCAAAAGVLVNMVDVEATGEDGKPYAQTKIDYRCKMHRPKRPKGYDTERLEGDPLIRKYALALIKDDTIQMQYSGGDIFAGVVVDNRKNEETVLVQILPRGDLLEVEWKWILAQDPSEMSFPDAILTAPLRPDPRYPPARKAKFAQKDMPEPDEPFGDYPGSNLRWSELVIKTPPVNPDQQPPMMDKGWWYYLHEISTDVRPKYTEDPSIRVHNVASEFVAPQQSRPRVYKTQTPARTQLQYRGPPGYQMQGVPSGHVPQHYNNRLVGYGSPQRHHQYQPPPHGYVSGASMSPPSAPVAAMISPSILHSPLQVTPDRRPSAQLDPRYVQQSPPIYRPTPQQQTPMMQSPIMAQNSSTASSPMQYRPNHHYQHPPPSAYRSPQQSMPTHHEQEAQYSHPPPPPVSRPPVPANAFGNILGGAETASLTAPSHPATVKPEELVAAPISAIQAALAKLARERAAALTQQQQQQPQGQEVEAATHPTAPRMAGIPQV